jgi:hypothetical protein
MYEEKMGMSDQLGQLRHRHRDVGGHGLGRRADLAVSQGVPPFVVATSAGQDLQILDVAVSLQRQ